MDYQYNVFVMEELFALIHIDEWRDSIMNLINDMSIGDGAENKLNTAYELLGEARQDIINSIISKNSTSENQMFYPFHKDSQIVACIQCEPCAESDEDEEDFDKWI